MRETVSASSGQVTIRDVAQAAGVSVASASRALTGDRPVRPATKRAVVAAARRLDYQTNFVARALRTQATHTVGMVVPYISNPFMPLIVEALERVLQRSGRELILCDSQSDPEYERSRIRALQERMVDGLLVVPCDRTASAAALAEAAPRVPIVQVDRYVEGFSGDFVGVDDAQGIALAVAHLRDRGCRCLAFVSAEPVSSSARRRLDGFTNRVAAREQDLLLGEFSPEWGRTAARELLARKAIPDGIVCGADVVALGLLAELREAGVAVPADTLVTGFDGIAFGDLFSPKLTTVRQPVEHIAEQAVRMLETRLRDHAAPPQQTVLAPTLIERDSTRRPVAGAPPA